MAENTNVPNVEEGFEEETFITLVLDDDSEVECLLLTQLVIDGAEYVALLPNEGEVSEEEEGEVYLYRYAEDADGNPDLQNIEDDAEYEKVSEAFDEWLDAQEFDEIVEGDE